MPHLLAAPVRGVRLHRPPGVIGVRQVVEHAARLQPAQGLAHVGVAQGRGQDRDRGFARARGGDALGQRALGDALLEAGGELGQDQLAGLAGAATQGVGQAVGDAAGGALGARFDAADEYRAALPQGRPCVK